MGVQGKAVRGTPAGVFFRMRAMRSYTVSTMTHSISMFRLAGLLFCLSPVAAAVAQTSGTAAAQASAGEAPRDSADGGDAPEYNVVITGSRAEMSVKDTPQRIEVVTRRQIEATPHAELADLLGKTTSVDIKQYPGLSSAVGMRGFAPYSPMVGESLQTLVLQDGIPAIVNELSMMPTAGVSRIEVLQGPASSLYGSQAMAGVINLIPVRRTGALQGGVEVSAGTMGQREVQGDIGGALTPWLNFDYFGGWHRQGDYSYPGGTAHPSGYDTYHHDLRLGFRLAPQWQLDVRADLFKGNDVENPGALPGYSGTPTVKDMTHRLYSAVLRGDVGNHALSITGYRGEEHTSMDDVATDGSRTPSFQSALDWHGVQLKDEWQWHPGAELVYGFDYQVQKARSVSYWYGSPSVYQPDSRQENAALYAQQNVRFNDGRTSAYVGGRYDHFRLSTLDTDDFPDNAPQSRNFHQFSPSAGIRHALTPALALHATIGRGYAAPSAWKLSGKYSSYGMDYQGNPALKPESSVSADIGLSAEQDNWNADVTLHDTRVHDKIVAVTLPGNVSSWTNADRARMQGMELSGRWRITPALDLGVGYSYSFRAEQNNGSGWTDLEYVPRQTLRASLDGHWGNVGAHLGARYVGRTLKTAYWADWTSTLGQQGGYTLWDASMSWKLAAHQTVRVAVDNLFNRAYQVVPGYPMPGREVKLTYRWDFL